MIHFFNIYKKDKKIHKHLLDDIASNGISIPIDPNHKKNEIKKIIRIINNL